MASLAKLRRRQLRWWRYMHRIGWNYHSRLSGGYDRAVRAVEAEQDRRFWVETPVIWLGGPAGEAALLADVDDRPGCTLLPPPAISTCYCTGRRGCRSPRPDDSCRECGDPDCYGDCWDEPEPGPRVETITVAGGVL